MPGKRGGSRPGAGRKPTPTTEAATKIEQAIDLRIEGFTLDCITNLKRLADGGYERTTETRELAVNLVREVPAGLVMRPVVVLDDQGQPRLHPKTGQPLTVEVPAYPEARPADRVLVPPFPEAQPGQLVVTRRVTEWAGRDLATNEYLLKGRLGKPKQALGVLGPDRGGDPADARPSHRQDLRRERGGRRIG